MVFIVRWSTVNESRETIDREGRPDRRPAFLATHSCLWPIEETIPRQLASHLFNSLATAFISGESKAETTSCVALQASAQDSQENTIIGLLLATLPADSEQ